MRRRNNGAGAAAAIAIEMPKCESAFFYCWTSYSEAEIAKLKADCLRGYRYILKGRGGKFMQTVSRTSSEERTSRLTNIY